MDIKDSQSWKALGAAMKGRFEDLRSAISLGADLGAADSFGRTAMLCACEDAGERCAELIMDSGGFDPGVRDCMGRDALSMAAMAGCERLCEILAPLSSRASRDKNGFCALCWAAQWGHAGCAKILLDAGWSGQPRRDGSAGPLMLAAKSGKTGLAAMILASLGPDAASGRDMMRRWPAMHCAAMGDEHSMRALISACPESMGWLDLEGSGLLAAAAWNGKVDCLRALVELGADLHARDPAGNDCLWWAAAGGSASCCEMLAPLLWPWPLMAAMDPAMAACEQGHMDLHRWLVEFDQAKRQRQELASGIDRAGPQEAQPRL